MTVKFAQFLEKVMFQNTRDPHERVRVDPTSGINLIDVVPVTVQLFREPGNLDSFSQYNLPYHFSNMWILFLHGHKKS